MSPVQNRCPSCLIYKLITSEISQFKNIQMPVGGNVLTTGPKLKVVKGLR